MSEGNTGTPGQAERSALYDLLRQAAGEIKRCRSVTVVCQSCEAQIAAVLDAADAYALAAQERPAPAPDGMSYGEIFQRAHGGDSWANLGPSGRACVQSGAEAVAQAAATAVRGRMLALAAELDRLAGEHMRKADGYDRDAAQENFHRGCSAALRNNAGRVRQALEP